MRLDSGLSPADGLAWARFDDRIKSSGWSELYVDLSLSLQVSNDAKMYAAGYLEGLLTCVRLSQYYANTHKLLIRDEATHHSLANVKGMIEQEIAFLRIKANLKRHIMTEEPKEDYDKHTRYLLFQLWGVTDGYNFAAQHFNVHTLSFTDLVFVNSGAEMPELVQAYTPQAVSDRIQVAMDATTVLLQAKSRRARRQSRALGAQPSRRIVVPGAENQGEAAPPGEDPLDDSHWEKRLEESGHCSAFVRVTEGNADLLVGHTTWDDYSDMTRIFKYYNFNLPGSSTMATNIGFSSYPGAISSMDDFYVMNSGMAVMETSLELLDLFAWDNIKDFPVNAHIPGFMHVMACNRLAKSAAHWARLITTLNVGTYNAQWMIVDYNKFKPGLAIPDNTLWVVETIPGMTHKEDLSNILRTSGYWASYNRPYFDPIRDASGHNAAQKSHGDLYSFLDSPRGKIFRTSAGGIGSLYDLRMLMTRNLYPFAGVEPNEPGHEISARMDLAGTQPIPNGGIDAKVTNRCLFKGLQVQATSGPSHGALPVFKWTNSDGTEKWPGWPHDGQPDAWNFGYVQMTPVGVTPILDLMDC